MMYGIRWFEFPAILKDFLSNSFSLHEQKICLNHTSSQRTNHHISAIWGTVVELHIQYVYVPLINYMQFLVNLNLD